LAEPTTTAWRRRKQVLARQLPGAILIQLFQRSRRIGNFIRRKHPVVVRVQRIEDHRINPAPAARWPLPKTALATRPTTRRPLLRPATAARTTAGRTVLREQAHGRQAERQRHCGDKFKFHNFSFVVPLPRFRIFLQPWKSAISITIDATHVKLPCACAGKIVKEV